MMDLSDVLAHAATGWMVVSVAMAAIVLALVIGACMPAKTVVVDGIPNLRDVGRGVWRGGQPTTLAAWQALYDRGVRHVVKLNFPAEGSDDLAAQAGLNVETLSIQPEGDQNIVGEIAGTFEEPSPVYLTAALSLLRLATPESGYFVHCTHGQDRTGLVVGMLRVQRDGWEPGKAFEEMVSDGFHVELEGLMAAWLRFETACTDRRE